MIRLHAHITDQIGDAMGEDARLAGAGASQHEDGAGSSDYGLLLLGVEAAEEVH